MTKTETAEINEASDFEDVAASIERSLERWGNLRDQMIVVMKVRQDRIDETKASIPEFVKSLDVLLTEVIVTLQ